MIEPYKTDEVEKTAAMSHDGVYRYKLTRSWDSRLPTLCIIGLNPSTADACVDDPTIRRCVGFARRWGYGSLVMVNLYAYRATKPMDVVVARASRINIIGEENDRAILDAVAGAKTTIAAWGTGGPLFLNGYRRDLYVKLMIENNEATVGAFAFTKDGHPRHPLYLPNAIEGPTYDWPELIGGRRA